MKINRNEPCPCGSGKKYKKCCLQKKNLPIDLLYHRLTETYNRLLDKVISFVETEYGPEVFNVALDEFFLWRDVDYIDEIIPEFYGIFIPWFVFNWFYDPDELPYDLNIPEYTSIVELYRSEKGHLDSLESEIIEKSTIEPYCFYEVISSNPGKGFRAKNILSGEELDVIEKNGSENLRAGDILFACIINIRNMNTMIYCWKYLIPIGKKPIIIALRRDIAKLRRKVNKDLIIEYQEEIRDLLFDIYESFFRPPVICNTDGDPLVFHRIHYNVNDPEEVFYALCDLCVTESPDELRKTAVLDENGKIEKIEFPWTSKGNKIQKSIDNTLLGHISINKHRMTIEVNSENRAKKIRNEVESRLKDKITYKTTEISSLESVIKQSSKRMDDVSQKQKDLSQLPEIKKEMENFFANHWKGWINERIPALGGKTPRQAVKTPDGRESVEALLKDAELNLKNDKEFGDFQLKCIKKVRAKLGLDRPYNDVMKEINESEKRAQKEISGMIERFGKNYLDSTHTELALKLCKNIGESQEIFLSRGRPEIWASSIIYVICQINFLFDNILVPSISPEDILNFFKTKKSTVTSKSLMIRKMFDIEHGDEEFSNQMITEVFNLSKTEEFYYPEQISSKEHETKEQNSSKPKKNPKKSKGGDLNQLNLFDKE